ncbi:DUF3953 domain-containing protein [Bacillus clarus]|uniref:DUF3953 domain-containing protein n=1 Tax=Bacillus clarus TaxID=2338372 RepID=A0A090ZDN8_9BACI|nr:YczI family protein [Bacillus clarus]KFN02376.1 hypothetical protein DJ93_1813 [Bacillus clarus]RFT68174.1 DUF3953 domain-containing protein [Bacillus clarus]
MLHILRFLIAFIIIIISVIGLITSQDAFLPLSQFLLGALMFIIAIEQIKKKDTGTGLTCILVGAFVWIALVITYIK